MSVQRFKPSDDMGAIIGDTEGPFVYYKDYASLNEKLEAELRATWAEHFLLSRENSRLQIELAMVKALLEPRVVPARVGRTDSLESTKVL